MAHEDTDKFCVHWQGRRSRSYTVQKHGVFMRCTKYLAQAVHSAREVSKRRGSSALTLQNEHGGEFTLLTCLKTKCKVTHFGKKLGLRR